MPKPERSINNLPGPGYRTLTFPFDVLSRALREGVVCGGLLYPLPIDATVVDVRRRGQEMKLLLMSEDWPANTGWTDAPEHDGTCVRRCLSSVSVGHKNLH